MRTKNDHYMGALLEDIVDRLKKVQESLEDLPVMRQSLDKMRVKQDDMRQWRSVVDPVIRDHNTILDDHEKRLTAVKKA